MILRMSVRLIIILFFLNSCSTSTKNKDESSLDPVSNKYTIDNIDEKDSNLIITRLNAKIDELKLTIKQQESKIKVLEQSIILGITPNEYLKELNARGERNVEIASNIQEQDLIDDSNLKDVDDSNMVVATNDDQEAYSKHILYAEEMYNSGNFGRAIVEYFDIVKKYPNKKDESIYYWIGMCWYNLKEYRLAEESLNKFIQSYPNNKYVPDAKFNIALCYKDQGFTEKAIKDLKNIIEQYPDHSVSKKAKQQITIIGKN